MKPDIDPDHLSNSKLRLTDVNDIQHRYVATAFFMLSRFSDSIAVVKEDFDGYVQYIDDHFSARVNISYSKFADLIVTSSSVLVFYNKVRHNFFS